MNTIHRLQQTVASQAAEIAALREGLHLLHRYVNSAKFVGVASCEACPNGIEGLRYVNISDIDLRVREIGMAATDAADLTSHEFTLKLHARLTTAKKILRCLSFPNNQPI